eukprot:60531-Amphidinium_carterae.1
MLTYPTLGTEALTLLHIGLAFYPSITTAPACVLVTYTCCTIGAVQTVSHLGCDSRAPHELSTMLASQPTFAIILVDSTLRDLLTIATGN